MYQPSKALSFLSWLLRITAAVILAQTLFFKFTAAPESVYIFDKVGLGTPGRIGSGIAELIAAILLLIPGTVWLGAGLALAVMGGAIMSHLTVLGIVVMNDHGLLFGLAITVALCSAILLLIHRRSIPVIGKLLP
jgi:putative oxidoreductase